MKILEIEVPNSFVFFSLPVAAYSINYLFELGYFEGVNVDYRFIQINPTNLFSIIFLLLALGLLALFFRQYVRSIKYLNSKVSKNQTKFISTNHLLVMIIVTFILLLVINHSTLFVKQLLLVLPLLLSLQIAVLIYEIDINILPIKFKYFKQMDDAKLKLWSSSFKIFSITLLILFTSFYSGFSITKTDKIAEYTYIVNDRQKFIVIKKYSDTILVKALNSSTMHLEKSFQILPSTGQEYFQEKIAIVN